MTTRYPSRSLVCLLACLLVVALPVVLAAAPSAGRRSPALLTGDIAADAHTPPPFIQGSDFEILVGELSCRLDPFGSDTLLSFRPQGTVEVSTGGMGELISTLFTAPEDPCPAITEGATEVLQNLGCTVGPGGNATLKFICHDERDTILEIMATVSKGVLTASF
jgi:hypothetical protein